MVSLFLISFVELWTTCESGLRIIGGRDALQDEFPYTVRLEEIIMESSENTIFNYNMFCTGAALQSAWVLSAAHCVDVFTSGANQVSIKEDEICVRYNSYFTNNTGILTSVIEIVVHPGYTQRGNALKLDIALIRCVEMKISKYGRINSVDFNSLVGHEVLSLGFGYTNASSFTKPLQVLKGMLNKCLQVEIEGVTPHMICLTRPCYVKATTCSGDSGGPVVHASGFMGVHSMSVDNCNEYTKHLKLTPGTSAAIISPVSPVIDWITNVIAK